MKKVIDRLKSPVVWLAVVSQIALIVAIFNPEITDTVKAIGAILVEIFTLFGILNNPENKEGF